MNSGVSFALRSGPARVSVSRMITAESLEPHRPELTGHCYRMLGSVVDADDAVQETMIRAWKSLDRFEGRSSVRTWLYRIATNVCLDVLAQRKNRMRPMDEGDAGTVADPLIEHPRTHWLEPVPDDRVVDPNATPDERAIQKQNIRLAFVAALQHLPPNQRAALLLTEVLGWSAAEAAETLGTTTASVNSALQRARTTLGSRLEKRDTLVRAQLDDAILERYVDAFHRYDVDALTSLLCADATFSMPPYALWLQGPEAVRGWLLGPGCDCRGSKLLPARACGLPAFAQYRASADGVHRPWALIVLEPGENGIGGWNSFLDTETLFPLFGLPSSLPA